MEYENLIVRREEKVAVLSLNRPKSLNALSPELIKELTAAFNAAATDPDIGAILLTGEGRAFSSGADLSGDPNDLPRGSDGQLDLGLALEDLYNPFVQAMRDTPKPVVAAVNGVAAGAAAGFAMAADLTIAARSAYFLQAFVNIGLMPDAGCTYTLGQAVGPQRAMGMAMLGERISAEQARDWGLIWDVVEDEALPEAGLALATRLSKGPLKALGHIKQAIHTGQSGTLDGQLQLERELQCACGRTDDFVEGAKAFVEKRRPHFNGR